MVKSADYPLRSLAAGFPVKSKPIDLSGKGLTGPMGTRTHAYWTNFSRKHKTDYEVLETNPEIPGYWMFITNLEPEDFEYKMLPKDIKNFLFKMLEIYRTPENG